MGTRPRRIGTPGGTRERPALFFRDAAEFSAWLEVNHETETQLWMGLYKKHVRHKGLTWAEAVPVALCFGWIDSVAQRIDEDTTRQRWTPRKATSIWSPVNIAHVERLLSEGLMRPAGLAAYEKRTPESSAVYSYLREAVDLPEAYAALLAADPAATAFWEAATPGYRKQVTHWVLDAKREATRNKRMAELVADCAAGRMVSYQRYGDEPAWVKRAAAAALAATS